MKKRTWLPIIALLPLFCGCFTSIQLVKPAAMEKISLPSGDCPYFSWKTSGFGIEDPLYRLDIASDEYFRDIVYEKDNISQTSYRPEVEDVFFKGGSNYYWRVTGFCFNQDGSKRDVLLCKKVRSFYIEERPSVRILFKIPDSNKDGRFLVKIGEEEYEKDFGFNMEVGEWVWLTASLIKNTTVKNEIGGKIKVLTSNEATKYGNIIIDALTHNKMNEFANGSVSFGTFTYELGGDTIAKMILGDRTE